MELVKELNETVDSSSFVVERKLMSMEDYFDSLNDYDIAGSAVNKYGNLTRSDIRGVVVETSPDKFGIILGHEFNPIVYRGMNNDWVFMPDSQRYELFDGKERIRHSINWIKKQEFLKLMSGTPYFTRISDYKISGHSYKLDTEAISKHFNYMSDYVDVTRSMEVAYFFAYTYYDNEKKQYLPIENFENYTPIIYAGSLRELYYQVPDSVKNICWQPFQRTKLQQTMSINTSGDWQGIQRLFRKIPLAKNSAISKYIYDLFEGGVKLFPNDYISRCAAQVRDYKTLHNDLISKYCEDTKTDEVWLRSELEKLEYEFVDQPWYIPEQANNIINSELDDYIFSYLSHGFSYGK